MVLLCRMGFLKSEKILPCMLEILLSRGKAPQYEAKLEPHLGYSPLPVLCSYPSVVGAAERRTGYQVRGENLENQLSWASGSQLFPALYRENSNDSTPEPFYESSRRLCVMYELKVVRERRQDYRAPRRIQSSREVYDAFRERFERADREEFLVVLLDAKNRMLGFNVVSVGSLSSSLVHPREVFKPAILANAASIILVHNHPSGDPYPSAEDTSITKRLREVGEIMGVNVLDHVIIGEDRYLSFVDDGYWDK